MYTPLLMACHLLLLPTTSVLGQGERAALVPGTRVRVRAPLVLTKGTVSTLVAVDPSSLTLERAGGKERVVLLRSAIRSLEVSERRSYKRRGALIGAGIGLLAALLIVNDCSGDCVISRGTAIGYTAIVFVPGAAGLGALVSPGERWVRIPTPIPKPMPRAARPGPLQVAFSVRF